MKRTKTKVPSRATRKLFQAAETIQVPITKLRLDPRNIRLRYRNLGKLKDEELEEALWKEPRVDEWYNLILNDGGITEPLSIDSDYVVREGNERLICLRKLSREAHNGEIKGYPTNQFDTIPCKKIPPTANEQEIAIWLARIHVTGKHPWKPFNKALMIYELSTVHKFNHEEIRKNVGVSKFTVQTSKSAYEAILQYQKEHDDVNWHNKYSYYHEIYKNEQLRNWARENGNLKLFGNWIYSGKIPRGEEVRKLKELILNTRLLAEFKRATVEDAKEILKSFESGGSKSLRILVKARDTLRQFPLGELRMIVQDQAKWQVISDFHQEFVDFMRNAESLRKS